MTVECIDHGIRIDEGYSSSYNLRKTATESMKLDPRTTAVDRYRVLRILTFRY